MWITTLTILYLISQNCLGINLVDLPDSSEPESEEFRDEEPIIRRHMHVLKTTARSQSTRHWLFRQSDVATEEAPYEDEKDHNIKTKITTLIQQTLHDTERKIKSIQHLKDMNRDEAPYRIGFILSLVKKAREILNELFNVGVKHRDSWKALEQLKIFELIVHTNVDTTNLVRQLVETHIQHMNDTGGNSKDRSRVVLL